ncbi:muscle M-line assembly protein unc-89-like isoform X2 [Saccostrea echinata]|uniref:muscle M-line assembly protein unc-89-like isoform X2 n=1 Tax=Saccostrea echinata TaxID=191078 RepID=UPI002A82B075|nr:muscle M-line assembly protein unc-89-like isoform X2 [Saccostrea echinata]
MCSNMEIWILCVLLVGCEMTWCFPTPASQPEEEEFLKPASHPVIETIEAGKNNTLYLIQEVAHSDQNTQPNPTNDLVRKVIGYTNNLQNSNKKFLRDYETESEREKAKVIFEYSSVKLSKPESLSLSRREALQQTDVDVDGGSWSTMVLTIASTLVALFSMSVLVAVFQCCCRRRKRSSSPEIDDKEEKTADDKNKNNEKVNKEEASKPAKEQNDKKQGEDSQEKTDDKLSFKDKLKAFEKKDDSKESPLRPGPTPKKRPQSEAFKAFEGKGIIMGMPMGQSPRFPKPKETQNEEKEDAEVTMRPKITITPSPDGDSDSGSYKQPDNPDVVIADEEDDDSEFGAIKRETAVLRSYRKAPPPKNRNRSSAAFRRKNAQQSMAKLIGEDKEEEPLLSKDNSLLQNGGSKSKDRTKLSPEPSESNPPVAKERSRSKTPEKSDSEKSASKTVSEKSGLKTPNKSDSKPADKTGSKTPEKAGSKTPDITGSKTPEKAGSKTPNKERSKTPDRSGSKTPEEKPAKPNSDKKTVDKTVNSDSQASTGISTGGNIFAQIDPTVKKTSPTATTPTSLETKSRADKVKSSPLFLEDDKLMKALNERLKAQQEENDEKDKRRRSLNTDL